MKKMLKKGLTAFFAFSAFLFFSGMNETGATSVYKVKKDDSLYKIGQHFGVSVQGIKSLNHLSSETIFPGQNLALPASLPEDEKELLARLVAAEAKGEPYAGKVAVAVVVLNRLHHPDFPDTIREVIYSKDGGYFAFTPVANGEINKPADEESKKAVQEALAFQGQGNGSLYFYNPEKSTSKWITTRDVTIKIGNHIFAK